TMDKLEIIALAQRIDTFDLSVQPFEDCCTIFAPPAPKTKPHLDKARRFEALLDVEPLVMRAVAGVVVSSITGQEDTASQDEALFSDLL
ncbi:MAG: tRNA 4-thiouridine(8) synthase ThiI, partial [Trichococcus flocculiformis]